MPGSNNGTGSPLTFQCWQCRRSKMRSFDGDLPGSGSYRGRRDRVLFTGKFRRYTKRASIRMGMLGVQYKCRDCGHVGWTRHSSVIRQVLSQHYHALDEATRQFVEKNGPARVC